MNTQLQGMDVVAEVIREYYDLGEVEMPQQLEAAHQRRHRKMVVQTTSGRFLAKTYKRDPVILDALRFQHRLSDHLDQNNLPVARIKRAKNGKGIVEINNWALELQEFVEGEPMKVNSSTLVTSAKALGQFHKVCHGLPAPPRDANMWRFSEVPRSAFQKLFEAARAESSDKNVGDHCNAIALFLQDAGNALSIDKRSEFEIGLIHGDWHGANLLFKGDELTAIIDLEFAGNGCYLEDIAYGISNLCIRTTTSEEKMRIRTNMLLDYYQFSRRLSYAEQVALYYAVGVKHITTVSYQTLQSGKVAGFTAAEWMERLHIQTCWLAEQARKARWGE
ncbi:MAG TPA: phosphotransferase [Candidatus Hydrogenedentes bacterium]|nr:phosphotransferase [Candidatus Hydrogenedentota bacterium]